MNVTIYSPSQQAIGAFDGGKITEQKPIGFPGEDSTVKGIGPLFYWAWAHASEEGYIPMHPHQAFEIITYMVYGQAEHADTLGTRSVVAAGGAQVMQTGSGVSHAEKFIGPDSEGFQIWFEPFIREALQRKPTYNQYEHGALPVRQTEGTSVKAVIGEGSPIELVADVQMWDLELLPGSTYRHILQAGRTLSALAIRGDGGVWTVPGQSQGAVTPISFNNKDYSVLVANGETASELLLSSDSKLRMILIEVPTEVDYPLYKQR